MGWRASIAVFALATACGAPPANETDDMSALALDPTLAQPHDVSVLLPLPADEAALASRLGPSSAARGGALLPAATYHAAFGPPGTLQAGGTPAAPDHARLRLVALRLDPCFAARSGQPDSACDNQIRLVLQTMRPKDGAIHADDNAVHAFYRIGRAELEQAVDALVDLRLARGQERLGPLGPHPLAGDPAVADAMQQLVASLAGAENLSRITVLTSSGLGTAWNFSGSEVVAGGVERMKLAQVPPDTEVVASFKGFGQGAPSGDPAFVPPSLSAPADNMQLLGNAPRAAAADHSERQRAFDALVRIENPSLHTPDTTDCASCHSADPLRRLVGEGLLALSASEGHAFDPDADVLSPSDVSAAHVDPSVNLHMFGYVGLRASIHRRTINETAAVVAYLNGPLLDAP